MQVAQGVVPGLPLRGRNGEYGGQRGPVSGQAFSHRPDGNRVPTSGVRPAAVADGLPEHVEPAAPLLVFNSYATGVVKQPELASVRSSRRMNNAKQVGPLRQVDPMGEGIRDAVLFL